MDEKKTELLAGLKGLSEEALDAIAGGLLSEEQIAALTDNVRCKKAENAPMDDFLRTWARLAEIYEFDDETTAQGEEIIRGIYAE